jgi:hypothetical protein
MLGHARTLVRHSLPDELFLWVHPMLAGIGASDDLLLSETINKRFTLLDVQRLNSGVVILSDEPKGWRKPSLGRALVFGCPSGSSCTRG